jgi:hypothetical protein
MNPKYLSFNSLADSQIQDQNLRGQIIAAAIGLALATVSPLPSSEVDSPASHFNLQVMMQASQVVSQFNENLVFDPKLALEYGREFWLVRYTALYPNSRPIYATEGNFFEVAFGASAHIAPDRCKFLCEQKIAVLTLTSAAINIIRDYQENVA